MPVPDSLSDRVTELESIVTHLQHDLDQINTVLLEQRSDIVKLQRFIGRLEERLQDVMQEPEEHDPQVERPPHY